MKLCHIAFQSCRNNDASLYIGEFVLKWESCLISDVIGQENRDQFEDL